MNWTVWMDAWDGTRVAPVTPIVKLSVAKVANTIGAFSLTVPATAIPEGYLTRDRLFEFWRDGKLVNAGFLRRMSWRHSAGVPGGILMTLSGPDCQYILDSRIINSAAWQSATQNYDRLDDMMKNYVKAQIGSTAGAGRDWSGNGLAIEPNLGEAPFANASFEWERLWDLLVRLAGMSANLGNDLYFFIEPYLVGEFLNFKFRTTIDKIGLDRTSPNGYNPVILSYNLGNLTDDELVYDYFDEKNAAFAAGRGEGSTRPYQIITDDYSINLSPWGRREIFVNVSNETVTAGLVAAGQAALKKTKPKFILNGTITNTQNYRIGKDFDYGDLVTVEFESKSMNGMISNVKYDWDTDGSEVSTCKITGDISAP